MIEPPAEYDTTWKEALGQYFQPFLELVFPQVHELVDWTKPPQSLDKELEQILQDSESGLRIADKLFQVWQRNNQPAWILIHVEVQSQEQSNFAQRMYIYNYRAFDLYLRPVISLAVLGDERASWRPSSYGYALGGCEVSLKFPIAKLLDYETQWQTLDESTNPFAVIVMAHLKTKATTGKPNERKQWKWTLIRRLFERGYSRDEVINLFRFIDRMMALPSALERELKAEVRRYQEERQMPFLSQMELMAIEEGREKGREEGLQQGLQIVRESVLAALQVRFETVPPELVEVINNSADITRLRQLLLQAIAIPSLTEFQQLLATTSDASDTGETNTATDSN